MDGAGEPLQLGVRAAISLPAGLYRGSAHHRQRWPGDPDEPRRDDRPLRPAGSLIGRGGPGRDRTCDQPVMSRPLLPLSYGPPKLSRTGCGARIILKRDASTCATRTSHGFRHHPLAGCGNRHCSRPGDHRAAETGHGPLSHRHRRSPRTSLVVRRLRADPLDSPCWPGGTRRTCVAGW